MVTMHCTSHTGGLPHTVIWENQLNMQMVNETVLICHIVSTSTNLSDVAYANRFIYYNFL